VRYVIVASAPDRESALAAAQTLGRSHAAHRSGRIGASSPRPTCRRSGTARTSGKSPGAVRTERRCRRAFAGVVWPVNAARCSRLPGRRACAHRATVTSADLAHLLAPAKACWSGAAGVGRRCCRCSGGVADLSVRAVARLAPAGWRRRGACTPRSWIGRARPTGCIRVPVGGHAAGDRGFRGHLLFAVGGALLARLPRVRVWWAARAVVLRSGTAAPWGRTDHSARRRHVLIGAVARTMRCSSTQRAQPPQVPLPLTLASLVDRQTTATVLTFACWLFENPGARGPGFDRGARYAAACGSAAAGRPPAHRTRAPSSGHDQTIADAAHAGRSRPRLCSCCPPPTAARGFRARGLSQRAPSAPGGRPRVRPLELQHGHRPRTVLTPCTRSSSSGAGAGCAIWLGGSLSGFTGAVLRGALPAADPRLCLFAPYLGSPHRDREIAPPTAARVAFGEVAEMTKSGASGVPPDAGPAAADPSGPRAEDASRRGTG